MSFFEILAESSIALAGFGAVHAVLEGADSPRGLFRAWTVVLHGLMAFVLSVMPLLLAMTSLLPDQVWRLTSAAGLVCVGLLVYISVSFDRRLTGKGHPPQATMMLRTGQASSGSAALFLVANLSGLLSPPNSFLYGVAVVLVLFVGLIAMLHSFLHPLQQFFASKVTGKD